MKLVLRAEVVGANSILDFFRADGRFEIRFDSTCPSPFWYIEFKKSNCGDFILILEKDLSVTLLDDPGYKYKKYKSLLYSQLEIMLKEIIDEINNGNFSHLQELADTIDGLENLRLAAYLKSRYPGSHSIVSRR